MSVMGQGKVKVTLTISPEVLEAGKVEAGLIPFSRWIESLIKQRLAEQSAN